MSCPRCQTFWCYVCGLAVDACDTQFQMSQRTSTEHNVQPHTTCAKPGVVPMTLLLRDCTGHVVQLPPPINEGETLNKPQQIASPHKALETPQLSTGTPQQAASPCPSNKIGSFGSLLSPIVGTSCSIDLESSNMSVSRCL